MSEERAARFRGYVVDEFKPWFDNPEVNCQVTAEWWNARPIMQSVKNLGEVYGSLSTKYAFSTLIFAQS